MAGGTIVILFILAVIGFICLSAAQEAERERKIRALQLADVDRMPGLQFEHYVARLYKHRGYSAQVTNGSGDLGVDVIASKWGERLAVQVKRQSKPVSRRAVSDAVAGMTHYKCSVAVVVTNNYFTKGAVELARSNSCQLVNRDMLADWIIAFQGDQAKATIEHHEASTPLQSPDDEWDQAIDEATEKLEAAVLTEKQVEPNSQVVVNTNTIPHCDSEPNDIEQSILQFAEKQFPDNNSMQIFVVGEQTKDYHSLCQFTAADLANQVLITIREHARTQFPDNFSMQWFVVQEQVKDYRKLVSLMLDDVPSDVMQRIRSHAEKQFPTNYSMQLFVIKEQVKDYRKLARRQ